MATLTQMVRRRREIQAEMKALKETDDKLKERIMKKMASEGLDEHKLKDGSGYAFSRPRKMVYNHEAWRALLKESAPKVLKSVFKKVETFDEKALLAAIEKGDIDGADDLLADDEFVTFEDMTPRLMPIKPKGE